MPDGPPPPPTVQKLRIRYAKRDRLRFTSTRDFQRALERALRLAQVPMAYSAGFHPHPKISYTNAAPTGTASEAEYVEISVAERLDPDAVRVALDAALPEGYGIEEVVEATPGSLADLLQASVWRLDFGQLDTQEAAELDRAVSAYLALPEAEVTRVLKKGPRTYDTRSAVLSLVPAAEAGPCAILTMVVRHTTPVVRPEDVLTAMRSAVDLSLPRPPRVTRLAQGPLDPASAKVADPFAAANADGSSAGDA
ncbi:MAG: TIGR03936 family radical SAM-associated protein [Dermatophilus congolensis]|nr:TIGR03936 family radical SAM-associated protein [Dermatophilus congolensis]